MSFRIDTVFTALACLCTLLSASSSVFGSDRARALEIARAPALSSSAPPAAVVSTPFADATIAPAEYRGDVRDLAPNGARGADRFDSVDLPSNRKPVVMSPEGAASPPSPTRAAMPQPERDFAGLRVTTSRNTSPSATDSPRISGDVGPTVYVQSLDDAWGIFDKASGASVAGFTSAQLWAGAATGTPCDSPNGSDATVIYDGLADRWILTHLAFNSSAGAPAAPFYQCLAVSKSADPVAGGYYLYAVRLDGGTLPDDATPMHSQFAVWTDCLYMGGNAVHAGNYAGSAFAAFDRRTLYSGAPLSAASASRGFLAATQASGMYPATLSGSRMDALPAPGTAAYFVAQSQTAFVFEVRRFQAGASACGSGATLSAPTLLDETPYAYPANAAGSTREIVPGGGAWLDSRGDELAQRPLYRRVGAVESLWLVHTTCGSAMSAAGTCFADAASTTQPQWAELDVSAGAIAAKPSQLQLHAPAAGKFAWVGSVTANGRGDMALLYRTAARDAGTGIAFAGRLGRDASNTLPLGERTLSANDDASAACDGASCASWGDYAPPVVDPSDDCLFWFSAARYSAAAGWDSRVAALRMPDCAVPAATATQLAFAQQPTNTKAGSNITPAVTVQVQDSGGALVTTSTASITLAIGTNPGTSTLSGTTTANAVGGIATFSNLKLNKSGTGYTLTASSSGLTGATSTAFNITAGAASAISFSTQPVNSVAGTTIPVVAHVQDANGNPLSGDNVTLAIASNPGGSTLSVTANPVATNASGNAVFNGVSLNKIGGYMLSVTDSSTPPLTVVSSTFSITAGAPATLTFGTQPANAVAGATIAVAAHVQDANGNGCSGDSVTLAIVNNPGGATLAVTTNPVSTNVIGDATFSGVSLNKVGTGYTLKVTDASTPALTKTSNAFNISAGPPAAVSFSTQPVTSTAGATIPVVVHVQDSKGNPVTGDNVTLTIATNAGGSTLTVTTNPLATNASGDATFAGVSLNKSGTGYTLKATEASASALSSTSSAFNITAGAPAALSFSTQPVNSVAGATIPVTAHVQDANGNAVSGDNVSLTLQANPGGSTLSVTTNPLATNASGNAVFSGVSLNKLGTGYTLTATEASASALAATSNAFNISAGPAATVSFSTQPGNAAAGATIPVVVHVQDVGGNPISGDNVTLSMANNAGGSTLTVTTNPIATNASGNATFSGVSLNKSGNGYTLMAIDASTPALSATSNAFNVTAGAPAAISFTTQPVDSGAGAVIPLVAHVQDANGNAVSGDNVTLTLQTNPGGATLSVTTNPVATDAGGDATFNGVSLNKVGTGYRLRVTDASTPSLGRTSNTFNITVGAPATITFSTQPTSAASGATIPLVAHVQDAGGNAISGDNVTLSIANNPGGSSLSVTTNPVTTNASGDAIFAGVSLNKSGTGYTLKVSEASASALNATSNAFNIGAGAAAGVSFAQQPTATAAGASISPAVTVTVQDAAGNFVNTSNASITLAIASNPGGSALGGTTTVNAVAGVATFGNLTLNKVGSGYTLSAASSGLSGATSNAFDINAGAPASITFSTQPTSASAGAAIPLVAHVQDIGGNPVSGDNVTLAIANNPGGASLSVTTNPVATNAGGDATFNGVSLNKAGTGYTLKVTEASGSALNATSNAFNITVAVPSSITFSTQPADAAAGAAIALVAHVQDMGGNPVPGDNVTLSIANNAGGSTLTVTTNPVATNALGDAVFTGVSLNKIGNGYTLKVSDASTPALTATSSAFNISAGAPAQLLFTNQPNNLKRGNRLGTIAVTEQDANGNVVPDNANVAFTIAICAGTTNLGNVAMNNGVATLVSRQRFYTLATGLTINAAAGGLNVTSGTFNVTANTDYIFADGYESCRP